MTQRTTSESEFDRPRVRRGLGVLVGAAICVMPLAAAPAASAQTASGDTLGGLGTLLTNTVSAVPTTVGDPLGGDNGGPGGGGCTELAGIGPFLTCLIDRLDKALGGGQTAQARIKARAKTRVLRGAKVRWVVR